MFRPRIIAMGVLAAALAFFATSTAASAHDSLIGSSPEEGQRLEAAPAEVSLRFTADVLPIGAAVIVSDADDRDWVSGEVVLVGDTVTAPLEAGMPDAGYELRWRVVSSDGHPISGLIPFTVGDGEPIVRPTTGSGDRGSADGTGASANDDAADAQPDDAQGQITDEGSEEPGGVPRAVWLGIGGAVIALAIAALIAFIRRRTRAGEAGDAGPDADAAPEPSTAAQPQHSRDDASSGQHPL